MTTRVQQLVNAVAAKTALTDAFAALTASSDGLTVSLTDAGLLKIMLVGTTVPTTITPVSMSITTAQALWLQTQITALLVTDV